MIVKRTIFVALGILLLIGMVGALIPDNVEITGNSPWIVAGSGSYTYTVTVTNKSTGVQNADISFTGNPVLGTLVPGTRQTDSNGIASSIFTVGTKSGTSTISIRVQYNGGSDGIFDKTYTFDQNINHYYPQYAVYDFLPTATVGTVTHLNITLKDQWGNFIDNKNSADAHPVPLYMATDGGAGFKDGSVFVDQILRQTDADGNVSVDLRVSTIAGRNYFQMDKVGNINDPQLWIEGLGSTPAYISQTFPSPDMLPADGAPANYFTIYYSVTDQYSNPVSGASIDLSSSDSPTHSVKITSPSGMVKVTFGPKDIIGHYTLSVSTPGYPNTVCIEPSAVGSCSQVVEFYNTDPVDMVITANPQGMASLDVDGTSYAVIQAKVMDIKGNPVTGELVRFSNATPTYPGGPYIETIPLHLSATSATTASGYATIQFIPGAFSSSGPGYIANATGSVVVTAKWTNKSGYDINRDVTLVWKNYPYLSISSNAACNNAQVGESIPVTIKLSGDGAALKPKPIEAMLAMDISGSMGNTPKMDGPLDPSLQYKLAYSKLAGTTFVNKMDPTTDMLGLTTFRATASTPYSLSAGPFTGVTTAISDMSASGNTNTRSALKLAIEDIIAHSTNPKAVKAIILLTDGAYNSDGDPLARKTGTYIHVSETQRNPPNADHTYSWVDGDMAWYQFPSFTQSPNNQNMAEYARLHNIRIYTVTLGVDPAIQSNYTSNSSSSWQIYDTMDQIAAQTGGSHYHAKDGNKLIDVYTTIAGQLQETAGGDTQVALNFGTVNINDQASSNIGQYMIYNYSISKPSLMPGDSTYVRKTYTLPTGVINTLYEYSRDDTNNWTNLNMEFDVGTIKLNEAWTTTFLLNLTKAGKIEIFGPTLLSSAISFTDASTGVTQNAFIPAIQCNVRQTVINTGYGDKYLSVDNLTDGGSPTLSDHWPIQWNTTYNGGSYAQEEIKFKNKDKLSANWETISPGGVVFEPNVFEKTSYLTIDTTNNIKWPPGNNFCIQITAIADDVNGAAMTDLLCRYKPGSSSTQYIKLE